MAAGIREAIKNHSTATIVVAMIVVLGALGYTLRSESSGPPVAPTKVFCTTDEGQTVFVAEMSQIPPFEHEGKAACWVCMFTADGGKTKFPGYLERFTAEAKKRFEAAMAKNRSDMTKMPALAMSDTEVKKPGAGNPWVSRARLAESSKITHPEGPAGAELDIVTPP